MGAAGPTFLSCRDFRTHLWYVADVHFHVTALAGSIQPLHVHVQRPGNPSKPESRVDLISPKMRAWRQGEVSTSLSPQAATAGLGIFGLPRLPLPSTAPVLPTDLQSHIPVSHLLLLTTRAPQER